MKPYKIIKTKGRFPKKAKILSPLEKCKIPLVFFRKVFTPPKGKIILPN